MLKFLDREGPFLFLVLLWLQFFGALVPTWKTSDYYEFGWIVPFFVFFLAFKRLVQSSVKSRLNSDSGFWSYWSLGLMALSVVLLLFLRICEQFDQGWRVPLWFHAILVVVVTHTLIAARYSVKKSIGLGGVTLLALTAVPLPSSVEINVIQSLTDFVMNTSAFLSHWFGIPVEAQGRILILNGRTVEVAEGCSGIRSLQTMIMWVFLLGEWFRLRILSRFALIFVGIGLAVFANVGRATTLAWLVFEYGEDVFSKWHDNIGYAAFVGAAGGVLLFALGFDKFKQPQQNKRW